MRPVTRGLSPQTGDFSDHKRAADHLKGAIGRYCSYCERYQPDALHVEHIQPSDLHSHLYGRWENYLLACPTCNGTKTNKDVTLDDVTLPDRDNTFAAFRYRLDGKIEAVQSLDVHQRELAEAMIRLVGLSASKNGVQGRNSRFVAHDRIADRMAFRAEAESALNDLDDTPTDLVRRRVAATAKYSGGFSIWMDVFAGDPVMRRLLIEVFPGTARDCFDATTAPVSPRPLGHGLTHGSKV